MNWWQSIIKTVVWGPPEIKSQLLIKNPMLSVSLQIGLIVVLVRVYFLASRLEKRRHYRGAFVYYILMVILCCGALLMKCHN